MDILRGILFGASQLPQYQQGFLYNAGIPAHDPKETYCNNYARDILDSVYRAGDSSWAKGIGGLIHEFNYDISPINPGKSIIDCLLNTTIQVAYTNLLKAAEQGLVKILTAPEAQVKANAGMIILVTSSAMNHEAIVCPDSDPYDNDRGPLLAQAGVFNGILYASDKRTFGAFAQYPWDIKYVQFKWRT